MSMSVFLPALPVMTTDFETTSSVMQLTISLYLATTACVQLIIGQLSDRFGRRPVLIWTMGIFVLSAIGMLLSPTIEIFLAFRMLGAAVASALVISRAIVRDMVPQEEAASMIGYVTMGMAIVPMVAPSIGGGLNELFGWQSIFVFLTICGIAAFALIVADLGETSERTHSRFLDQVRTYPELLASRRFWGYVFASAFASGAFFAFLGGASFVASDVFGLSSLWTGIGFGAPAIGYIIGNFLSGRYSMRVGINLMILAGTIITAAGMAVSVVISAFVIDHPLIFFLFASFVGLGNGLTVPNAAAGMLSVRPQLAGTASGLGNAIMVGGGAALSLLAGFVLTLGSTSVPLQILMASTSTFGIASIYYVIRRENLIARRSAE